jgi:polar amino acid transport system substrate-binding protein
LLAGRIARQFLDDGLPWETVAFKLSAMPAGDHKPEIRHSERRIKTLRKGAGFEIDRIARWLRFWCECGWRPDPLRGGLMVFHRLILALALSLMAFWAVAQETTGQSDPLKIGTHVSSPFVIKNPDGSWEGISIDLLAGLAKRNDFTYELVESGLDELTNGVAAGRLDASIAAISVSAAREKLVDFTHPYYRTSLGVAVAHEQRSGFIVLFKVLATPNVLLTLGLLISLLLLVGSLVWLVERRHNPGQFEPERARGLFSGFWWAAVTMTTVGYGDKAPITVPGRLIALVWMFLALILASIFIAQITAELTSRQVYSPIKEASDLAHMRVGVLAEASSNGPLTDRGVKPQEFQDVPAGLAALESGQIDAFVHDEPILQWHMMSRPDVELLNFTLEPQDYAIVLPEASPLLERINQALLEVVYSDDWDVIRRRYLGDIP